jgi:hypothetical protein
VDARRSYSRWRRTQAATRSLTAGSRSRGIENGKHGGATSFARGSPSAYRSRLVVSTTTGSSSIVAVSRTRHKVLRYAVRYGGWWYVRRRLPSTRKTAAGAVVTGATVVAALLIVRRVRTRSPQAMPSSTSVRYDAQVAGGSDSDLRPPQNPI